ncbi:MAG: YceD family protein [Alphaproteobacteria bacterium]
MMDFEFSRPLDIESLKPGARPRGGEAKQAECAALAKRLEVSAVHSLAYSFDVEPFDKGKGVRLKGTVEGRVTLNCVVTLEDFEAEVVDTVELSFHQDADAMAEEALKGVEDPDSALLDRLPEPLDGMVLDLGEVATQQFALALPDYPRKPGAAFENPGAGQQDVKESPFAALQALKTGNKDVQE